jgi:large subunit ribosomal protein L22
MSPRKVRLVIDTVRGLPVSVAESRLQFMNKGAALPVLKLLRSAIANAEHNFKLDKATLTVKTITADGGPVLKRFQPRAFGRGAPIRKRTTHINLVLTSPQAGTKKSDAVKVAKDEPKAPAAKKPAAKKPAAKKPAAKKAASATS